MGELTKGTVGMINNKTMTALYEEIERIRKRIESGESVEKPSHLSTLAQESEALADAIYHSTKPAQ